MSRLRPLVVLSFCVPVSRRDSPSKVLSLPRETQASDHDLVERVRSGDRFAEDALVRRHLPALAGVVGRLLGDPVEAEDVVQDTITAALVELDSLREPAAFRSWLLRMAVNKVHRRFRRRALLRTLGFGGDDHEHGLAELASEEATPEQRAELVLLDRALARLPSSERIAWTLRCVEGLRLDEVAAACGCSLATAKRRITAADRVVREHVGLDAPGAKR